MTDRLDWSHDPPLPHEYLALREAAGMGGYAEAAAVAGLAQSLACVTARDARGGLAAMARLVGDGALFAQVTDVAVRPDLQRRGIGSELMRRLMARADALCLPGCYLSLIADPGAERLYRAFGFETRHGMARRVGE